MVGLCEEVEKLTAEVEKMVGEVGDHCVEDGGDILFLTLVIWTYLFNQLHVLGLTESYKILGICSGVVVEAVTGVGWPPVVRASNK